MRYAGGWTKTAYFARGREAVASKDWKAAGYYASINRYETGTSSPTLETLLWYADYFDVSMDYIFGRTDKPQGKLYKYQLKYLSEDNEMRQFVEMCFDPNSPVNDKLKQMIVDMLREGKK